MPHEQTEINRPPRAVWRRWYITVPSSIAVLWYGLALQLLPNVTIDWAPSIAVLAQANMRSLQELAPADSQQAHCVLDRLGLTTKIGSNRQKCSYSLELKEADQGCTIACVPDQPYAYREGWLYAIIFLERRRFELPTITLSMPEGTLVQSWPNQPNRITTIFRPGNPEDWLPICEHPSYVNDFADCCE